MILKLSTESPSQWNHTFGGEIEDLLKVGHLVSTRIRVEEGDIPIGNVSYHDDRSLLLSGIEVLDDGHLVLGQIQVRRGGRGVEQRVGL